MNPTLANPTGTMASAPCPGGCEHSDAEHEAFDAGVVPGE